MRIAVVGCTGRVNQVIIQELEKHPHCTLAGILVRPNSHKNHYVCFDNIAAMEGKVDAIIDFSNPATSLQIAKELSGNNIILVSGTTGFTAEQFVEFKNYAKNIPIIWSANMSIGINLLHAIIALIGPELDEDFDSAIIDIHHHHKKDSPSGTALSLAETITNHKKSSKPQISSLRIGEEFGSHEVIFSGSHESITLSHKTNNRNSYAIGAIKACLWGKDKPAGFYSMQDVLAKS